MPRRRGCRRRRPERHRHAELEQRGDDEADRISAVGWLRSMKPPLIPTSACPTASTPTIDMVKVIASTV